ncbi:MAG TPA: 4-hydroxy-tetrahydrodipicolinate reductase [Spirochaetota bacterium]|nr:4-hydroxy-tetrahydrodipicolinate reductase [Spirochaetota bacterium]
MNVGIVGYGKMGRQIERILKEKGINVVSIIDNFAQDAPFKEVNRASLKGADMVIDFASSEDVVERIIEYKNNCVSVVMGTTGWYDDMDKVKEIVENKIGFIWSGNFSLGVNIFFRVLKYASSVFNNFPEYDPLSYEIHHKEKKDSPSGTSLMIGDILKSQIEKKSKITTERLDRKIESEELHIASVRGGYHPGIHSVQFDSPADTIEFKHTARNREGLAYGAVQAAIWLRDKKGFFNIDDFFDSLIQEIR